jgi:SNF2 family DNA or RNA helicase
MTTATLPRKKKATYRFKTRPYAHQKEALRKLISNGYGGGLLMEPRTGKTKTTIDYMSMLHMKRGVRRFLVVCPTRVMGVWAEEFHVHCPYMAQVIIWDSKARRKMPTLPDTMGPYDMQVVVINYEAFATPGKKLPSGRRSKASGRFKTRKVLLDWAALGGGRRNDRNVAMVLDESHKIKSPSGKAATMVVSMQGYFGWRVILTGTPVTKAKKIADLYMQWKFLNPARLRELGIQTHQDMQDMTGKWIEKNGYPQFVGTKQFGLAKVREAIFEDSYAVKRADCFDLPPRENITEYIRLKGESARVYDEMAEEMVARLENGEITEASIALVLALRLAQITGGTTKTTDGNVVRVGREKLDALKPHLEDALEREEKLVVAARFKPDMDAIASMADKLGLKVWQIRGGIKRQETDEYIREFRKWDDAGVMVVQPQAASLGIDLSTASKMIWMSLTPSYVDYTQCCDRIALSRNSTTFVYLLAEGTVDELLMETLENDHDVAQMIITDPRKLLRTK